MLLALCLNAHPAIELGTLHAELFTDLPSRIKFVELSRTPLYSFLPVRRDEKWLTPLMY